VRRREFIMPACAQQPAKVKVPTVAFLGAVAYAQCRANKGAAGVDGQDFADIEAYGVAFNHGQ
jgi:hypothetical protein